MIFSGGGFAPSYNVQLSVDAAHDIIVNVDVSEIGTDTDLLTGPMKQVEERMGKKPAQVVADGGYTNNVNILAMADAETGSPVSGCSEVWLERPTCQSWRKIRPPLA